MIKLKYILVLNSGSTSLKFKIFNYKSLKEIHSGIIEKIGLKQSIIEFDDSVISNRKSVKSHQQALKIINDFLLSETKINISLIIHRVVHGGSEFNKPTILNKKTIEKISKYNNLAPLHNPINLKVAKYSLIIWPNIKQVAVFDTLFFQTLPVVAYLYPIPIKYLKKYHIRKFGFHGFSHQGMLIGSAKILKKKINKCNLIACHLGGGCSISAIKNGKAIESSMGFSPMSGLMMMTRAGDIDPAIILYLRTVVGLKLQDIYKLLNFHSGLKGISKINDLRDIMILAGYKVKGYKSRIRTNKNNKVASKLALNLFIYRIQRYISSYVTLLPKIDAIAFSGAIGERNFDIRSLILKNLKLPKSCKKIIVECNEEKNMAESVKAYN